MDIQPLKILIVDDVPSSRKLLQRALTDWGHDPITVASGEEALTRVGTAMPDLILMDVKMDGMDGYETTRRIRMLAGENWVPIIFQSGLITVNDMVAGMQAGGDDYLLKPIDLHLLKAKIGAFQRIAALQRANAEKSELIAEENRLASHLLAQVSAEAFDTSLLVERFDLPVSHVSGDMVFCRRTPSGKILIALADAAGHGLAAAVTLLPFDWGMRAGADQDTDLPGIAFAINKRVNELFPVNHFIAALLVLYSPDSGKIAVLNAGSPAAKWLNARGEQVGCFNSICTPLGLWPRGEAFPPAAEAVLGDEDRLLLFSDGLIEARNPAGEAFGEQRLLAALQMAGAGAMASTVKAAVETHCGQDTPHDDMSLVCLRHQTINRQIGA